MPHKDEQVRKEYKKKYYQLNKDRLSVMNTNWAKTNKAARKKHQLTYQVKSKLAMLEYKGGCKCVSCGYDAYYGALEFHHVNPEEKEIKLSETHSFTDEVRLELDKCVVLCANCHREVHAGIRECPILN